VAIVASTTAISSSVGDGVGWQSVVLAFGEDAVEDQRVEVDVEVEAPTEPLDDGQTAGAAVADAVPTRAPPLEGQQRPHVDSQHGAA
jgi:hypothetical protein